jgi:hypothetical protein
VIHRDLKPGNLFLIAENDGTELVKIVDFGIAKIQPAAGTTAQNLTQPGEVFGSPLYMSPEQCQGKSLDARADIYSLGCVIYETLTGVPPLMGINSFETMNKHVAEKPPSMRGVAPHKDIPDHLDACVLKALSKDRDQRQQSMIELRKELLESVKGTSINLEETSATSANNVNGAAPADADRTPDEELHKLVNDAVDLTKKQDAHNKKLRQMVLVLYGLLGSLVLGTVVFATWPGPPSDPAPLYKRELYLWKITEGEQSIREGRYKEGIAPYRAAVEMSKRFGDGTDKKTKALFGLLVCLQRSNGNAGEIDRIRHELLDANVSHMEYIYGHDGRDLVQIVDLDAGLLERIGGDKVDTQQAEKLAKEYVREAQSEFSTKNYMKAISWLLEALEIEEQSHCDVGVSETAAEFKNQLIGTQHLEELNKMFARAQIAEKDAKERSH